MAVEYDRSAVVVHRLACLKATLILTTRAINYSLVCGLLCRYLPSVRAGKWSFRAGLCRRNKREKGRALKSVSYRAWTLQTKAYSDLDTTPFELFDIGGW